jgi:hypothetical protein
MCELEDPKPSAQNWDSQANSDRGMRAKASINRPIYRSKWNSQSTENMGDKVDQFATAPAIRQQLKFVRVLQHKNKEKSHNFLKKHTYMSNNFYFSCRLKINHIRAWSEICVCSWVWCCHEHFYICWYFLDCMQKTCICKHVCQYFSTRILHS